jgi:MerR family transcriptional regulator, light-induced transcriptional regulator
MYTIKRASELVGVSDSTLRAWERRYGVVVSRRTDAGYRLYDEAAVRTLSLMHGLVLEGWSVRAAAEETRRRLAAGELAGGPLPVDIPAADDEALARVAASFDTAGLSALLDQQFGTGPFETTVDGWLLPALRELGTAWESGRVTVAGEHLVAHGVARRLAAAYETPRAASPGPQVVIGLPAGARHELGLLSFAAAARRTGLATTYLGADVPASDWAAAVTAQRADCAVLAASMPEDVASLEQAVAAITTARPGIVVAVGGDRQEQAPRECLRLGHELGSAAALLADRLSATRPGPPG